MAIKITFDQFLNDQRVWQAFVNENLAFFNTSEGNALMNQLMDVRKRYRDIEKHIARYPNSTVNWQVKKDQIRAQWQGLRGQIWNNPNNPANPDSPLNPANTAPAAAPAAAAAAPPVYLPTVNAPQYMFPTAESVRDMTYDPGIGGFLRPNNWQSAVPAGQAPQGTPGPYGGPNMPQPGSPTYQPQLPQPGSPSTQPQFPWQPGY